MLKIRDFCYVLLFFTISLLQACNTSDEFTPTPTPPGFDVYFGQELRTEMQQLAIKVQQLDLALSAEPEDSPSLQQNVIANLNDIETIFSNLREGDINISHPFLVDDIDNFVQDVQDAISDATADSPHYFMAGKIAGGCTNCHIQNR